MKKTVLLGLILTGIAACHRSTPTLPAYHYQKSPLLRSWLQTPSTDVLRVGVTQADEKVFPDAPYNFSGQAAKQLHLRLARNEAESLQLVLVPKQTLVHVQVKLSPLEHTSLPHVTLPASATQWWRVGFVDLVKARISGDRTGWHPDPLFPLHTLTLKKEQIQSLILTVTTHDDTPPGDYHGEVIIKQGHVVLKQIPITVTVWNFQLPDSPVFKTSSFSDWRRLQSNWPTNQGYRKLKNTELFQAQMRLLKLSNHYHLPANGFLVNGLYSRDNRHAATRAELPTHKYQNGMSELDTNTLKKMFSLANRYKLNNLFVGFTYDIYKPPQKFAERKKALLKYVQDYMGFLKNYRPRQPLYLYNVDEPWKQAVEHAKSTYDLLKPIVGDRIHIIQNTNQNNAKIIPKLLGHFDALDINLGFYDIVQLAKYRQQYPNALHEVWWNVNLWPATRPNLFIEYPLVDARIIGAMSFKYHIQGFEYWDLTFITPKNIADYAPVGPDQTWLPWKVGDHSLDGLLAYPTRDYNFLPSLRLLAFRDGIDDNQYLAKLHHCQPNNPLLKVETVRDLTHFENSSRKLQTFREQLAAAILKTCTH